MSRVVRVAWLEDPKVKVRVRIDGVEVVVEVVGSSYRARTSMSRRDLCELRDAILATLAATEPPRPSST